MILAVAIPPELTNTILAILTIVAGVLATLLSRRGKHEDNKIAERGQAFTQMAELAKTRGEEIVRKDAVIALRDAEIERLRTEINTVRQAMEAEITRVRTQWEERWDRQMDRCRKVTRPLVDAIQALRAKAGPGDAQRAEDVLITLENHNERDHAPELDEP